MRDPRFSLRRPTFEVFCRDTADSPTGSPLATIRALYSSAKLSPSTTRFTQVIGHRIGKLQGDYHLLDNAVEALARFDEIGPDLVVLDERCDPAGDFVNKVKAQKKRSLTSVIKIYPDKEALSKEPEFKIWENDYLVDPFEMQEFFALTEAELLRVPKDRKVFSQQVRFDFQPLPG